MATANLSDDGLSLPDKEEEEEEEEEEGGGEQGEANEGATIPGFLGVIGVGGVGASEDPNSPYLLPYSSLYSFTEVLVELKTRGFESVPRRDVVQILQSIDLRVMGGHFATPASATDVAFLLECLAARKTKERTDKARTSRFASIYNMLSSDQPLVSVKVTAEFPEATVVSQVSHVAAEDWKPQIVALEARLDAVEINQVDDREASFRSQDSGDGGKETAEAVAAAAAAAAEAAAKTLEAMGKGLEEMEAKKQAAVNAAAASEASAQAALESARAAEGFAAASEESALVTLASSEAAKESAASCAQALVQALEALKQAQAQAREALESAQEAALSASVAAASAAEERGGPALSAAAAAVRGEDEEEAVAAWVKGAVGMVESQVLEQRVQELEAFGKAREEAGLAARLEAESAAEAEKERLGLALARLEAAVADQEAKRLEVAAAAEQLKSAVEAETVRAVAKEEAQTEGLNRLEGLLAASAEETGADRATLRKAEEELGKVRAWQASDAVPLLAELKEKALAVSAWRLELEQSRAKEAESLVAEKQALEKKLAGESAASQAKAEAQAVKFFQALKALENAVAQDMQGVEAKAEAALKTSEESLKARVGVVGERVGVLEKAVVERGKEGNELERMSGCDRWAVEVAEPEEEPELMATAKELDSLALVVDGHGTGLVEVRQGLVHQAQELAGEVEARTAAVSNLADVEASDSLASLERFALVGSRCGVVEARVGQVEVGLGAEAEARGEEEGALRVSLEDTAGQAATAQNDATRCLEELRRLSEGLKWTQAELEEGRRLRLLAEEEAKRNKKMEEPKVEEEGEKEEEIAVVEVTQPAADHSAELEWIRAELQKMRDEFLARAQPPPPRRVSSVKPLTVDKEEVEVEAPQKEPAPPLSNDLGMRKGRLSLLVELKERKPSVVVLPAEALPGSDEATRFALAALEASLNELLLDGEETGERVAALEALGLETSGQLKQHGEEQVKTANELRDAMALLQQQLFKQNIPDFLAGDDDSNPSNPSSPASRHMKPLAVVTAAAHRFTKSNSGGGVSFAGDEDAENRRRKEAEKALAEVARKAEEDDGNLSAELKMWTALKVKRSAEDNEVLAAQRVEAESKRLVVVMEGLLKQALGEQGAVEDKKAAKRERLREKERLKREREEAVKLSADSAGLSKCLSCDRHIKAARPGSPAWGLGGSASSNASVLDPFGRQKLGMPSASQAFASLSEEGSTGAAAGGASGWGAGDGGGGGLPKYSEYLSHQSGSSASSSDVGTHPHLGRKSQQGSSLGSPQSPAQPAAGYRYSQHEQLQQQLHQQQQLPQLPSLSSAHEQRGGFVNGQGALHVHVNVAEDGGAGSNGGGGGEGGEGEEDSVGADMTTGELSPVAGRKVAARRGSLSKLFGGGGQEVSLSGDDGVSEAAKAMAQEISGEIERSVSDSLGGCGDTSNPNFSELLAGGAAVAAAAIAVSGGTPFGEGTPEVSRRGSFVVTDEMVGGRPVSGAPLHVGGVGGGGGAAGSGVLTNNKGRPIASPQLASLNRGTSTGGFEGGGMGSGSVASRSVPNSQAALSSGVASTTVTRPSSSGVPLPSAGGGGFRMKSTSTGSSGGGGSEFGSPHRNTQQQQQQQRPRTVGDMGGGGSRVRGVGSIAAARRGASQAAGEAVGEHALRRADAPNSFGVLPNRAPASTRFYGLQRTYLK